MAFIIFNYAQLFKWLKCHTLFWPICDEVVGLETLKTLSNLWMTKSRDKTGMFHRPGKASNVPLWVHILHPCRVQLPTRCVQYPWIKTPAFIYSLSHLWILVFFLLSLILVHVYGFCRSELKLFSWERMPVKKGPTNHSKTEHKHPKLPCWKW